MSLALRGGKNAKKRAVVAVARKLGDPDAPIVDHTRGLRTDARPPNRTTSRLTAGEKGL